MPNVINNNNRLTTVYWQDIQEKVAKVNSPFAKLIDELSPGKKFPMYLAKYAYGDLIGDTEKCFFPNPYGNGVVDINDENLPSEVRINLQHGAKAMPFSMLLEKTIETFAEFPQRRSRSPSSILKAGHLFPLARILNYKCNRRYYVNSAICATAGAKSAFMLPRIGRADLHINLQNDYQIKSSAPKFIYDQWQVFKEIVNSERANSDWNATLLLFSDIWEDKIHNDNAWHKVRSYLYKKGWEEAEYRRNQVYYDMAFSTIQERKNLKPNPYLVDTARYLLTIAVGAVPGGYRPAIDDEALPLKLLQAAFLESYGLKESLPIIMEPDYFYFEDSLPIYYSLQNPTTHSFSPKSRRIINAMLELRELAHITEIFVDELSQPGTMCSDSMLGELKEKVTFSYYHNQKDRHGVVTQSNSVEIIKADPRIQAIQKEFPDRLFPADAKFMRGCVAICGK